MTTRPHPIADEERDDLLARELQDDHHHNLARQGLPPVPRHATAQPTRTPLEGGRGNQPVPQPPASPDGAGRANLPGLTSQFRQHLIDAADALDRAADIAADTDYGVVFQIEARVAEVRAAAGRVRSLVKKDERTNP